MRQFKIERQDRRLDITLPVGLTATDVNGLPLDQDVMTINVSRSGALLKGIRGKLQMASSVSLSRSNKREQFQVAWVGEGNSPQAGQIGVSTNDPASSFWNDVLEIQSQVDQAGVVTSYSKKPPAKQKAMAQRA
jgi:hypothetical protein